MPTHELTLVMAFVWERAGSFAMPCHLFSGVWRKTRLLALGLQFKGLPEGLVHFSLVSQRYLLFNASVSSRHRASCLFPSWRGPRVVRERHGRSPLQWLWQTPARARHFLRSMFSGNCCILRPGADPKIRPHLPRYSPYTSLL